MTTRVMHFVIVNVISISRIGLAALFLFLYLDANPYLRRWSFIVIALAVASDFADGALARRWTVATKFGYIIDGITDRASYVAVTLAICWRDGFPLLLAYVIIFRDFLLYGGRSYFPRWIEVLPLQRRVAHFHAGALRAIFALYLLCDAYPLFSRNALPPTIVCVASFFPVIAFLLTIASYLSLWLVWREQARLHGTSPFDEIDE